MECNNFEDLINIYNEGKEITTENVGTNRILINKEGFDLIISKDNTDEHGYFLVNSIYGHDCYSYNSESTHIYSVVEGEGEFIVDDTVISVKKGDVITIKPNQVFYYSGKMLLKMEMLPNFKEENDHLVRLVSYNDNKSMHL